MGGDGKNYAAVNFAMLTYLTSRSTVLLDIDRLGTAARCGANGPTCCDGRPPRDQRHRESTHEPSSDAVAGDTACVATTENVNRLERRPPITNSVCEVEAARAK